MGGSADWAGWDGRQGGWLAGWDGLAGGMAGWVVGMFVSEL